MSIKFFLIFFLVSFYNVNCNKIKNEKYILKVNGIEYKTEKNYSLMRFLREDLGITSVKDGCEQGYCGACSIIVDGELIKSCTKKIPYFNGKSIITVEGLSEREKEVFDFSFGFSGAVQCGFCTPGMVLAGKALIDQNKDPKREEIAYAIRNNICRCTGYKKIIDGIELAAKIFRENIFDLKKVEANKIGVRGERVDASEKILAYGKYVDDLQIDGMIYGGAVRSKYPRARVLSIDISKAKALPGVRAVITAEDIPGENDIILFVNDQKTLIEVGDITNYLGDAIVLIAADTIEILNEAKKLVNIEYEELQGVFTPQDALKSDAPKIHPKGNIMLKRQYKRGKKIEEVFKEADFVVSKNYTTPWAEHAYLERECAVAMYDKESGSALIYSSDQQPHGTRFLCAHTLGIDPKKVKVQHLLMGGAYGGKFISVQHHVILLAYFTGLPVKFKLTRDESILVSSKRHPTWIEMTTACNKKGKLLGSKVRAILDTGAYAEVGPGALDKLIEFIPGPYNYSNIDLEGISVYTNNPPAGAFRGFGVPQACFVFESNLNLLAEKVGISPWEIRYINAVRPGDRLPIGQKTFPSTGLVETLEAVKNIYENHPRAGIACGFKNSGEGDGIPDKPGRTKLSVENGIIVIRSSVSDVGQGIGTILTQIVRDLLNLNENQVKYAYPDTDNTPDGGVASGSRLTIFSGESCRRACEKIKIMLKEVGGDLKKLNGKSVIGEYISQTDNIFKNPNLEDPKPHINYSYATQVVLLNEDGSVEKVIDAIDVGKAMNPNNVEGQCEGGIAFGLGFAFTERFPMEKGKPKVKMGQLGLFTADKMPKIETILIEKGKESDIGFGANGIGEAVNIPTAAAAQGAYFKYDKIFRTSLPLKDTFYTKNK